MAINKSKVPGGCCRKPLWAVHEKGNHDRGTRTNYTDNEIKIVMATRFIR